MGDPRQAHLVRTFTQADFERFARLSGDANPIHTNPQFAAETRFGRPVAHGMMLVAILRGLAARLAPGMRAVEQEVIFPAPTFAGEPMGFTAIRRKAPRVAVDIDLEVRRLAGGDITCRGSFRLEP